MVTKVKSAVISDDVADVNLATDSVGADEIKPSTITSTEMANSAVTELKIADQAVTTPKIANSAVTTGKIAAQTILESNMATGSVIARVIATDAVETVKIKDLNVSTPKIANEAVTAAKIASRGITADRIGIGVLTGTEIGTNTVQLNRLVNGAARSVVVRDDTGVTTELAIGPENAVLAVIGGAPQWSSTVFIPGMMMDYVGTAAPSGWVMANGQTIGNAASSANGRANADTLPLFVVLWTAYANSILDVSGGRGGSAAADFAANKTIRLPDLRGRTAVGNDTMGNFAATRITNITATPDGNTLGATGGLQAITLSETNLPAHTHYLFQNNNNPAYPTTISPSTAAAKYGGGTAGQSTLYAIMTTGTGEPPTAGISSVTGSGNPASSMPPFWITNKILKL